MFTGTVTSGAVPTPGNRRLKHVIVGWIVKKEGRCSSHSGRPEIEGIHGMTKRFKSRSLQFLLRGTGD